MARTRREAPRVVDFGAHFWQPFDRIGIWGSDFWTKFWSGFGARKDDDIEGDMHSYVTPGDENYGDVDFR